MIEVAKDQLDTQPVTTQEAPAVIPDAARTEEVVEVHGNVEVVQQVVPSTPADTVTSVYGDGYADAAVNTLETPRDDLGALGEADAEGFRSFLPTDGNTEVIPEVAAEDQSLPVAETPAHGDEPLDDVVVEAEPDPRYMKRRPAIEAEPAIGGLGIDWKKTMRAEGEVSPAGEADERVMTPNGVDLTPLKSFHAVRDARPPKAKKPKRPQGERAPQAPQAPAAQRPALLRSEKSRSYLRDALGTKQEDLDGVHHINTSATATTDLGRALQMNAHIPFNHPDLGPFTSVGGLWFFVGMEEPRDDVFRTLSGGACRARGEKVRMRDVPGFRSIIADATWIKINSNKALAKAMAENTLPYQCYYTVGEMNMRQATGLAGWYMPVLEEIGRCLREIYIEGKTDTVPDFEFLERSQQAHNRPKGPHGRGGYAERNDRGARQGQDRRQR